MSERFSFCRPAADSIDVITQNRQLNYEVQYDKGPIPQQTKYLKTLKLDF